MLATNVTENAAIRYKRSRNVATNAATNTTTNVAEMLQRMLFSRENNGFVSSMDISEIGVILVKLQKQTTKNLLMLLMKLRKKGLTI